MAVLVHLTWALLAVWIRGREGSTSSFAWTVGPSLHGPGPRRELRSDVFGFLGADEMSYSWFDKMLFCLSLASMLLPLMPWERGIHMLSGIPLPDDNPVGSLATAAACRQRWCYRECCCFQCSDAIVRGMPCVVLGRRRAIVHQSTKCPSDFSARSWRRICRGLGRLCVQGFGELESRRSKLSFEFAGERKGKSVKNMRWG